MADTATGLAAIRRARAVELVASGCTYQQVADRLGYTSRGTAHNVVAKALREQTAEAVGSLRFLENARLNTLQHALWDAAMAGDVRAVMACVQIVQARVRLNGLEPAPPTVTRWWRTSCCADQARADLHTPKPTMLVVATGRKAQAGVPSDRSPSDRPAPAMVLLTFQMDNHCLMSSTVGL